MASGVEGGSGVAPVSPWIRSPEISFLELAWWGQEEVTTKVPDSSGGMVNKRGGREEGRC